MTDKINTYDSKDIVRREAVMIAGPLKIGAYRVKDLETGEFSPLQIHMTYDNMVLAVLGESSARLLARFVEDHLLKPEIKLTPSYVMSPSLVESGDIYVEVYPMRLLDDKDRGARLIEQGEEPDFYDVCLRPDDWDLNNNTPYGEWEDLSLEDAEKKITELKELNPGITVCWINP